MCVCVCVYVCVVSGNQRFCRAWSANNPYPDPFALWNPAGLPPARTTQNTCSDFVLVWKWLIAWRYCNAFVICVPGQRRIRIPIHPPCGTPPGCRPRMWRPRSGRGSGCRCTTGA